MVHSDAMDLLLVRHAIAVDHGNPLYVRDEDRPLTQDGIEEFRVAARALKDRVKKPDHIVSSPLVRAQQTAEILRDALVPRAKIELCEHLAPGGDHGRVVAFVTGLGAQLAALVGHEPHLSGLTSYLLVGNSESVSMSFKKGGAALVRFPHAPAPGRGTLEWLVQPGAR